MVGNGEATIYSIVGKRQRSGDQLVALLREPYHHSSVNWYAFGAGTLIGLGGGLLIGIWVHWRSNHD